MSERLKHKFGYYNNILNVFTLLDYNSTIMNTDCCKYCSKTAGELYNFQYVLYIDNIDKMYAEADMNRNHPCLTEDEYIIKKLLE